MGILLGSKQHQCRGVGLCVLTLSSPPVMLLSALQVCGAALPPLSRLLVPFFPLVTILPCPHPCPRLFLLSALEVEAEWQHIAERLRATARARATVRSRTGAGPRSPASQLGVPSTSLERPVRFPAHHSQNGPPEGLRCSLY